MKASAPLAALLLLASCAHTEGARQAQEVAPVLPQTLHVDPFAPEGGDGSPARPLKRLADALARAASLPTTVQLATGLYEGPLTLPAGTWLAGRKATILHGPAGSTVVTVAGGGGGLRALSIQGGDVGLRTGASVELDQVAFSAQRKVSVEVGAGGALLARDCELSGTISETVGVAVRGGRAELVGGTVLGAYRRGVTLEGGGEVVLRGMVFDGPVTGVHLLAGVGRISDSRFAGGRGPALYAAKASLALERVEVHGHEYAVLVGQGARLRAVGLTSVRAEQASVALTNGAEGTLEQLLSLDSGGGVQLVGARAQVSRFLIRGAQGYGVQARLSELVLEDGAVVDTSDPRGSGGDAVNLRGGSARLSNLNLERSGGSGVLAASDAKVRLEEVLVDGAGWGGLLAESRASLDGRGLLVRNSRSAAVVVPDQAEVRLDALEAERNAEGLLWVECAAGARVLLGRYRSDPPLVKLPPCVSRLSP